MDPLKTNAKEFVPAESIFLNEASFSFFTMYIYYTSKKVIVVTKTAPGLFFLILKLPLRVYIEHRWTKKEIRARLQTKPILYCVDWLRYDVMHEP